MNIQVRFNKKDDCYMATCGDHHNLIGYGKSRIQAKDDLEYLIEKRRRSEIFVESVLFFSEHSKEVPFEDDIPFKQQIEEFESFETSDESFDAIIKDSSKF